jgi:hypothetical protein
MGRGCDHGADMRTNMDTRCQRQLTCLNCDTFPPSMGALLQHTESVVSGEHLGRNRTELMAIPRATGPRDRLQPEWRRCLTFSAFPRTSRR